MHGICILAAMAAFTAGPEAFDPKGNHIQGIAASEDALYVAQMTRLVKLDWQGHVLASRQVQSHTGDIAWHDGELYTAVAVYPEKKEGRIQVFDKDLNLVRETSIDRTIDGIAYADGVLYVGMGAKSDRDKYYFKLPVWVGGNAYFNGAKAMSAEKDAFIAEGRDVRLKLVEEAGAWRLDTDLYDCLGGGCGTISTQTLGMAFEPEQRFEQPDGRPIVFNEDYFGHRRPATPIPGPFADGKAAGETLFQD